MMERTFAVRVRDGLHARPATQFVKLAKSFASEITITCNGQAASAKSAVKLMLLGIKEDDEATLRVEGEDAPDALSALSTFLQNPAAGDIALPKTGGAAPAPSAKAGPGDDGSHGIAGIAASEGTGYGPSFAFFPPVLKIEPQAVSDVEAEISRYRDAVSGVTTAFARNKERAGTESDTNAIIDALIDVAQDAEFADEIEAAIRGGQDAASATMSVGTRLTESFEAMDDPYIRARGEDMRSVTRQIVLALIGQADVSLADAKDHRRHQRRHIGLWVDDQNAAFERGGICHLRVPGVQVAFPA